MKAEPRVAGGRPTACPAWPVYTVAILLPVLLGVALMQRPYSRSTQALETTGYRVAVNRADAAELHLLPGIGRTTAARVVEHRRLNGRFDSTDAMAAVRQISTKRIERLRPHITLD